MRLKPLQLCNAYPRVVNRIAAAWSDPDLTDGIFNDLLLDRRGGRKGFPPGIAAEIVDGKYTVKGIEPGLAKVTVITLPPSKGGLPPRGGKPVEAPATFSSSPSGKYVPIPQRYGNVEQSGLTYEIKAGSQTKDFDLSR